MMKSHSLDFIRHDVRRLRMSLPKSARCAENRIALLPTAPMNTSPTKPSSPQEPNSSAANVSTRHTSSPGKLYKPHRPR